MAEIAEEETRVRRCQGRRAGWGMLVAMGYVRPGRVLYLSKPFSVCCQVLSRPSVVDQDWH
jgi:hypothetical protein